MKELTYAQLLKMRRELAEKLGQVTLEINKRIARRRANKKRSPAQVM